MKPTGRRPLTISLAAAAVALGVLGLAGPTAADPPDRADRTGQPFPERIDLPDGFQPEGIAVGRGPTAYVGSLADGDIARLDLRSGSVDPAFSEGPGSPSVGLDTDQRVGSSSPAARPGTPGSWTRAPAR